MVNFAESPGDHRSLLFDISTCSLLGKFRYKICRPVSRRLVTSQVDSVKRYNEIVREQFEIHRILERMDAVDKMAKYCGNPAPRWLRSMIIKLYKQMTEIRIHAKKKCRKILRPESDFSPTVGGPVGPLPPIFFSENSSLADPLYKFWWCYGQTALSQISPRRFSTLPPSSTPSQSSPIRRSSQEDIRPLAR
jgi:hypothetical protein